MYTHGGSGRYPHAEPGEDSTWIKWKGKHTPNVVWGRLSPTPDTGVDGDVMGIDRTHRSESLTPEGPHRQGTEAEL